MMRDDVLLRVIHQLVEALLRAIGLRKKNDLVASEDAIGDGLGGLGLSLAMLTHLDAGALARMLPDPYRRALVRVALLELARIKDAAGDEIEAERARALSHGMVSDDELAALPAAVRNELAPLFDEADDAESEAARQALRSGASPRGAHGPGEPIGKRS